MGKVNREGEETESAPRIHYAHRHDEEEEYKNRLN